ncbi:MAG TPA: alcohol dehydrogenase catalytic domain-containing protein [Clostridia bacterium]|nr:alcohol dehydrogenase catalytic domain-containing protein [Clostridia bacterium]
MINVLYRLVAPRIIDVAYQEVEFNTSSLVIRPLYLAICKADQRYYQGMRSPKALKSKLPMALLHECVAQVVYDGTGHFKSGDMVIPVPNTPTQTDDVIAENYLRTSHFRSSGYDGYLQDYILTTPDRVVLLPEDSNINLTVAAFTELISVSVHAITRFDRFSHSRRDTIGIWGDGNLGFITAILLRYLFPDTKLYIFGTVDEKLSYFTFADKTFHVDNVGSDVCVDHAFECVGGAGSSIAINQIIDKINPEGTISLMGVCEKFADINTRMVLEKGLNLYGSSRSGVEDFKNSVEIMTKHPEISHYLENLVGEVIDIKSIDDIHLAFDHDFNRNHGKTVLKWNK